MEDEPKRYKLLFEAVVEARAFISDAFDDTKGIDRTPQHLLLLASLLRLRQDCNAILTLAPEGYPEEVWVLARCMFELVVNMCYLQVAGEKETERYLGADEIGLRHQLEQFESSSRRVFSGVTEEQRNVLADQIVRIEDRIGEPISHLTWTTVKLPQRAEAIDRALQQSLFAVLYRDVYSTGNRYVHGNYTSIKRLHLSFFGQDPNPKREANLALSQVAKTLHIFCLFLRIHYSLDRYEVRLDSLYRLMDTAHEHSGLPPGNHVS